MEPPFAYLALFALFLGLGLWRAGRDRARVVRVPPVLALAARDLGFAPATDNWWRGEEVWRGELGGGPVELAWRLQQGQYSRDGAVEIVAPGVPVDLVLRAASVGRLDRVVTMDLLTGDEPFDEAVQVAGDPDWIRPRLDSELRGELLVLTRAGGQVTGGKVVVATADPPSLPQLLVLIRRVAAVRAALDPRRDAPSLADLVRTDPEANVRRVALLSLRDRAPATFRAVLPDALKDRSVRVRSVAVSFVAEPAPLRRLLGSTLDEVALTDALAAVRTHKVDGTEAAILPHLGHAAARVRKAAAEALAEVGRAPSVGPLRAAGEPLLESAEVRAAVRAALERVLQRVGPVEQGQVSLADTAGPGAVTLPPRADAGRLSLKEPDDGG